MNKKATSESILSKDESFSKLVNRVTKKAKKVGDTEKIATIQYTKKKYYTFKNKLKQLKPGSDEYIGAMDFMNQAYIQMMSLDNELNKDEVE